MNAWLAIRRLRGPAYLILVGITALLHQWGILSFGHSWPLYLILAGVLGLAERAALATGQPIPSPYGVNPYPYAPPASYPSPVPPVPPVPSAPPADDRRV